MCGIIGGVAQRDMAPILIEGLRRLEYRGYDSAGVSVIEGRGKLHHVRAVGKVACLAERVEAQKPKGHVGIGHTRWATHGGVTEHNAHPHVSGDRLAVVHNGIIENHEVLRRQLSEQGYNFRSQTDTEVIAHLVHRELRAGVDLLSAVRAAVRQLTGAYAIAVVDALHPEQMVLARAGSPLVIGVGIGEHFCASDVAALLPVTQRMIMLEEGDVALVTADKVQILHPDGRLADRQPIDTQLTAEATEKGAFRHYMIKEIFEQPRALTAMLEGRVSNTRVLPQALGEKAQTILPRVRNVHIVACGTSYHAGCVGKYWIESVAGLPCQVELASEYRYRDVVVPEDTLFVTLSQSGETADTLEALRSARKSGYLTTLAICNTAHSSMVRESELSMMTRAGPEIGVASTKAFTTQLMALLILSAMLGKARGLDSEREAELVRQMHAAAAGVEGVLKRSDQLLELAEQFVDKDHTLFLGRGPLYPIAMEGALKLKEISYIHAEPYAAGELKHGPLALIDDEMPVIVVAPHNGLLDKLKSNMQVVRSRGGQLYVFADRKTGIDRENGVTVIEMPHAEPFVEPIVYTVPLQLLAYHVAVLRGTDVDQPRNLAKSVTVE